MSVTLAKLSDNATEHYTPFGDSISLALLNVSVTPETAARLHVPAPSATHGVSLDKIDYSDGYGHDYAPGE